MGSKNRVDATVPVAGSKPAPWGYAPDGFHFEAVEQDADWRTPAIGAGRCRYMVDRKSCGRPAVASLWRGYRESTRRPWDYCAEHLYGRWIEDDKVMGWRLVKDALDTRDCQQSRPTSSSSVANPDAAGGV